MDAVFFTNTGLEYATDRVKPRVPGGRLLKEFESGLGI